MYRGWVIAAFQTLPICINRYVRDHWADSGKDDIEESEQVAGTKYLNGKK